MEIDNALTPNGNEPTDQCPICNRLNNPGATDHCEHYQGLRWDGGIIWSENFEVFDDAWHELADLWDTLILRREGQAVEDELSKIASKHGFNERLVFCGRSDYFTSELAAEEVIDFSIGSSIETDGMLSGSGHTLYHEDPGILVKTAAQYRELAAVSRRELFSAE